MSNVSDRERKDDDVLVSVRAAGLNFVDLLYVRTPSLLRHVETWTANESFIFVLLRKLKVACIIVSFTVSIRVCLSRFTRCQLSTDTG